MGAVIADQAVDRIPQKHARHRRPTAVPLAGVDREIATLGYASPG